jgi:hypothetical protein
MKYIITESQHNRLSEQSNYEGAVLKLVKRFCIDEIEEVKKHRGSHYFFHIDEDGYEIAFIRLTTGTLDTFTHAIKYHVKRFIPNVSSDDVNDAVLELMKEKYPELKIKRIKESNNFWYEDFTASEHP